MRPRHLAGLSPGSPKPRQSGLVHIGQHPPRGRVRCHRAEQAGLVAQHRQVGDRLAAVGEHHRHIDRDPARVMAGLSLPQPSQGVAKPAEQAGRLGHVRQQSGADMPDHAPPVRTHDDLRTRSGSLHSVSAFLDGRSGP